MRVLRALFAGLIAVLLAAVGIAAAGSYEICWSGGFEFGVTDDDLGYTYDSWRQVWIDRGMPWDSEPRRPQPLGWDPARQLADLIGGDGP